MIPFLGKNVTTDKKNEELNGRELLTQVPAQDMTESWETSMEETLEMVEGAKLPLYLRVIRFVAGACGVVGVITVATVLKGEDGLTFAEAYQNAGFLFWLGGIGAVVWLALFIMGNKKMKDVLEGQQGVYTMSKVENISQNILLELGVPLDEVKEVDVLSFRYKISNDKLKVVDSFSAITPYTTYIFHIYQDEENLYLANLDGKYQIPKNALGAIKTVKKTIAIPEWNKETAPNKGEYKKYKLWTDQYDNVYMRYYHILEFFHEGNVWGIYFPSYEIPIFEEMTGLRAESK